jgi:enoyl-CoA hydratase/carnithine racemase
MPEVITHCDRQVLTITLNRPEARNALSVAMLDYVRSLLSRVEVGAIRVVVISGTGTTFSAGSDLKESEPPQRRVEAYRSLLAAIEDCPAPVVAKLNGSALGGGIGIFAACDYVVTAAEAVFAFPEVHLGTVASLSLVPCLRRIGFARASDLFITGRRITATEAERFGLVDRVAAANGLDGQVAEYCDHVRCGAPLAVQTTRMLVRTLAGADRDDAYDRATKAALTVGGSAEAAEGRAAFAERRPPNWQTDSVAGSPA